MDHLSKHPEIALHPPGHHAVLKQAFHCLACGELIPLDLPIGFAEFLSRLRAFEKEHARCPAVAKGWCPQCGPRVAVDEDGCCEACGATAAGAGADAALAALAAARAEPPDARDAEIARQDDPSPWDPRASRREPETPVTFGDAAHPCCVCGELIPSGAIRLYRSDGRQACMEAAHAREEEGAGPPGIPCECGCDCTEMTDDGTCEACFDQCATYEPDPRASRSEP